MSRPLYHQAGPDARERPVDPEKANALMNLQTERLTLRTLEASDALALHGMMRDREVMAFWDVPEIEDLGLVSRHPGRPARRHGTGRGALLGDA